MSLKPILGATVCQIHQLYIWQKKVKQTLPKITYKTTSHFLSSAYQAKNACFILSTYYLCTLKGKLNHPTYVWNSSQVTKFPKLLQTRFEKISREVVINSTSHWPHTNLPFETIQSKFRHSEKATKIWKNLPLFLNSLCKFKYNKRIS